MYELAEAWRGRLRRDLEGFADRGVEPSVERDQNTLEASWTAREQDRSEIFGVSPEGSLRWLSGPSGEDSYETFLRSEGMAGFEQLARAATRLIKPEPTFVAGTALVDTGFSEPSEIESTPDVISALTSDGRTDAQGRTTLFFVKGDPGAGKTTLLREVAALQARRYLEGESDFLCLYVSAQGRELSNLRDAFSGELDDLRAGFTRDAVAALVRAGVLVPIVDGFDELLGTAGYSGAFSSLQTLLTDLEGMGAMIVSARSSFYDLEFLGRSSGPDNQADLSITTIGLKPWSDDQLRRYLAKQPGSGETAVEALDDLPHEDKQLLARPFFASQFPEYVAAGPHADSGELLEFLIDSYIKREADKIVDSEGDPVLPVDGHRTLFELTAGEMWEGESRTLSMEDLRTLTDIVAEEFGLGADQAGQLRSKVTSYAGFRPGLASSREEFAFEHEVYFEYFLTRAVQRLLSAEGVSELATFMDRGVMPEAVVRQAVRAVGSELGGGAEILHCSRGVRYDNRRRNFGTLCLAHAQEHGPLKDLRVQDLAFIDVSAEGGEFEGVSFDNCDFLGVDMSGARFSNCRAGSSRFQAITLANDSALDIAGLEPGKNVGSVRHSAAGDLYAPADIAEVLKRLGAPGAKDGGGAEITYSNRAQVLIKLLHHVARAFRRTTILYENEDDKRFAKLFGSEYWPDLRELLLKHGVVSEEERATSGRPVKSLRLRVTVDQLLTGQADDAPQQDDPVTALWRDLRTV